MATAMAETVDIDGTAHSKIDLPLKAKKITAKQEQIMRPSPTLLRAALMPVHMSDHNG